MARTRVLAALSIVIGVFVPLLAAEIVLRFLPVHTGLQSLPVDEKNPIRRFTPNRNFTFSKGWDFKLVNSGRTNNYGFVNDHDYDSTARSPLLAVIGDSYIEALAVPFPETLQGRLAQCVGSRGRVYSFGASGMPLSGYLAEVSYARSRFSPDGIVVVIVGNDLDESLAQYRVEPGTPYFEKKSDHLVLRSAPYQPSLARRVLRESALVRYLMFNLGGGIAKIQRALRGKSLAASTEYVGNTEARFTPERLHGSQEVVDQFLATFPQYSGVDARHTVLVLDAMRPNIYSDSGLKAASGSFFDVMRQYLISEARKRGYEVVDMEPRFIQRYSRDGSRFEFSSDHHWNGLGHKEAARAVAASKAFAQIFPGSCPELAREGEVDGRF